MFGEPSSLKTKTAITKTFFSSFHGLEVSEWGREKIQDFSTREERDLFARGEKHVGRSSILNDANDPYSVLGNLFQEG